MIALLEHINQKLLKGKNEIKDKARHLRLLAEERGFDFDEIELRNKFFGPLKRGKSIFLSKKRIKEIDSFLRSIKVDYKIDIEIVSSFKERYAPDELEEVKLRNTREDVITLLFKNKARLKYLEDTEWVLFERVGYEPIKNSEWGIAVGRIHFTVFRDYLHVTMNTIYKTINRTYRGIATHDAQKCLFLDLLKIEDSTRSNFILQLADSDVHSQSLLIGHYSFYSPSNAFDHILSKTVVLLKVMKNVDANTQKNYLSIGNYDYNTDEYKTIPQDIRSFLYTREMNRMSMPKGKIGDLTDLEVFLRDHRHNKINPILKKHFLGDYKIYYKRTDSAVTEDDLLIYFDEDAIKLMAKYTHKPDVDKKHNKIWLGQIYLNDSKSGISLELSNEKSKERQDQEDPILLTFWIPDKTVNFSESQCFPGVISGLEDSSDGPISFVCLAVRNNVADFRGAEDDRVKKYFAKQGSWVLQPIEVKHKLDEYH
ncbi:hypothetical protein [Spirosoma lituiforme]